MKVLSVAGPLIGLLLILYTFYNFPNTVHTLANSPYLSFLTGTGNFSIIAGGVFTIIAVLVIISSVGILYGNLTNKEGGLSKQGKLILNIGLMGMFLIELLVGNIPVMLGYLLSLILVSKAPTQNT